MCSASGVRDDADPESDGRRAVLLPDRSASICFRRSILPTITVTVVNPGASPQEIETEITDKVEGAVNTISGIDELRSTSVEGVSQVFITFLLEKNPDIAAQEVRNKIDLIVNDLPDTAETADRPETRHRRGARRAHRCFGAALAARSY